MLLKIILVLLCSLSKGIRELVSKLQLRGTNVYLVSGGFRQMIAVIFSSLIDMQTTKYCGHLVSCCIPARALMMSAVNFLLTCARLLHFVSVACSCSVEYFKRQCVR